MKRTLIAIGIIASLFFIYAGWIDIDTPGSIDDLTGDLPQQVLAYEVIDGTPLIVAEFGPSIFLDTLRLERISMDMPPYPKWQWTGMWERVSHPDALATADLTSYFGPTVLYGLINHDDVTDMHVVRDESVIQVIPVAGPAYIISVSDVKLTDTIIFVDANGARMFETPLMKSVQETRQD